MSKPTWKELQYHRDWASSQGEDIAEVFECVNFPINPLSIAQEEPAIFVKGTDLGDTLDGQLTYCKAKHKGQNSRFLLAYNTRYDSICSYEGNHCPKVRFTIAHELGHYFMDRHRNYLQRGGQPYTCYTEAYSDMLMELEADAFAAGLLMPSSMLRPIVNLEVGDEPAFEDIRSAAQKFQVSLTSMMVRWTKLSDFPCAVFSVANTNGKFGIRWGWVSQAFADVGAFWRLYGTLKSKDAMQFLEQVRDLSSWKTGRGSGMMSNWVDTNHKISVTEYYAVIPYARHLLVFLTAPENELADCHQEW